MSLSNWWTKRIRVNKPIDWANTWSLEAQARGISFEMDDQMNLKALPVVVIDTTQPGIVPASYLNQTGIRWLESFVLTDTPALIHQAPADTRIHVLGFHVDWMSCTRAAQGTCTIPIQDETGAYVDRVGIWVDTAPSFKPPYLHLFDKPLVLGQQIWANTNETMTIYPQLEIWGYDV